MKSNQNNYKIPPNTPITQRRLKTKPTLILLAILLAGNLFWFIMWLLPSEGDEQGGDEQVATVDGEIITRQQWLSAMESLHGKETLQNLVNEAVMEKAIDEYKIKVTDKEIDLEVALLRSAQDVNDTTIQNLTTEQYRQKVRAQLILEKVLTKDVVIEDSEAKKHYEDNEALYNIPTTYRTSVIIVNSKEEANSVKKELENGSDFSVLAREKSIDGVSSSLGGDIGYVTPIQTNIDKAILSKIEKLDVDETSNPFVLTDGRYAVVYVSEKIEGQSFDFKDVEEQIKRQLAMDQLSTSITPESFWSEFNAKWFYGLVEEEKE